jgi:hypothetical protein
MSDLLRHPREGGGPAIDAGADGDAALFDRLGLHAVTSAEPARVAAE